ncbi:hypothetical protein Y032_0021g367 [Ancylostoma ceylanicum]|nr:hypothetical protein Y032_0021g367 [Ancylostoma ceylanicum]
MVRNLIRTKRRICNQDFPEVEEKVAQILEENGYTKSEPTSWRPFFVPGGIPLVLPYVNEQNAKDVNRIVKAANLPIKLVFRPPPNLKSLLTSTRIYEESETSVVPIILAHRVESGLVTAPVFATFRLPESEKSHRTTSSKNLLYSILDKSNLLSWTMSATSVFIVALCLATCLIDAQRLSEERPDLVNVVARELREMMRHDKRDFRFHAARGKKYDPAEFQRLTNQLSFRKPTVGRLRS